MTESLSGTRATARWISNPRIIAGFAVFLVLCAYWPSTSGGFFSDDFVRVVGNQKLQTLPLTEFWRAFVERLNPWEYLPVRDLSYRLDIALFGLQPFGYHVHNVVLYALCCLAVWLCCGAILPLLGRSTGERTARESMEDRWVCAVVTILFAVHPAHAESVGWISGRKDLLSGLFGLLSLWQFGKAIQPDRPDWRRACAAALLFVLALMSKATLLPVAAVAVLLAAMRTRKAAADERWTTMRAVIPMVVLALAWFWFSLGLGGATGVKSDPFVTEIARRTGFLEMILSIQGYLAKIAVLPFQLRLIYDVNQPGLLSSIAPILGAAVLIGGVVGAVVAWRHSSVVGLGIALFVLFCLPYLQLIPYSTWSLANDRHLFLSIFAGALPVGVLLQRRRSVLLRLAVLVVTVAGVALTYRQASKWGDLERLIEDASRFSPGDFYAQQLHIQQILLPQRRYEEARGKAAGVRDPLAEAFLLKNIRVRQAIDEGRWDDAQRDGSELAYLAERSSHPELQLLLGTLAERRRDDVEALRHYSRAARIGLTSDVLSGARRGLASVRSGYADSLETLRAAAAGRPYDVVAQANLANLQMQLFLLDEAAERYRWILQGYASLAGARYNLGLIYLRQDRYRDATRELRRAITGGVASAVVWNNLGIAHKHAGDIDEAETAYIRALQLDPNHCNAAINLGRLYLAFGKLGQARAALLRARESACGVDVDGLIELYLSQVAGERQS